MKNLVHILVIILFLWFAYVQLNDPDPLGWVIIYLGISFVALLSIIRKPIPLLSLIGGIICIGGLVYLSPDLISWFKEGMPSITGQMKAESPHVELVREALGFSIAAIAYFSYYFHQRKSAG